MVSLYGYHEQWGLDSQKHLVYVYIQGSTCATYLHGGVRITWDKVSLALVPPLSNSFVTLNPFPVFPFGYFTPEEQEDWARLEIQILMFKGIG